MQVVAISDGLPVEFTIHTGAELEQTGRRGLALDLPAGSLLYTNAGYTDYLAEDLCNEAISKRPHHPAQKFLIQDFRIAFFIFAHVLSQVGL